MRLSFALLALIAVTAACADPAAPTPPPDVSTDDVAADTVSTDTNTEDAPTPPTDTADVVTADTPDDASDDVTDATADTSPATDAPDVTDAMIAIDLAPPRDVLTPIDVTPDLPITVDARADTPDVATDVATDVMTSACMPNPCRDPSRTVCVVMGSRAVCQCDMGTHDEAGTCVRDMTCTPTTCGGHGTCAMSGGRVTCTCARGYTGAACDGCDTATGYHPDGAGGCTTDPCMPDPCAARAMACRANGATAECYRPMCDDGNPCTDDTFTGGRCVSSARPDGSACSTSACLRAQTCQRGTCTGTTPATCDDRNPCTADTCDPATGCRSANDDRLVPDDGLSCTTDTCVAGAERHTAVDARCDDGRWCTGTEVCRPGAAGVDARGCLATNVPAPPASAPPCQSYGACNEATRSFTLSPRAAGSTCDDGIACTSNDVCTSTGACVGSVLMSCVATTACGSTVPLPTTIDVPVATLTGAITYNGAALPAMNVGDLPDATLTLVALDTGARQRIAYVRWRYVSGGTYRLSTDSGTYSTRLLPGIYDLVYERGYDSSTTYVNTLATGDTFVNGRRILRSSVVIGPGANVMNIDVASATVTGSVTYNGAALPAMNVGDLPDATLTLVALDTMARQRIAYVRWRYVSGGTYRLTADSSSFTTTLLPGTYDLVYERGYDSSTTYVNTLATGDTFVNGRRVLRTGVVINPGANTLNIDIPSSTVTGSVTYNGAALPAMNVGDLPDATLTLVALDTGARQRIAYVRWRYVSGGTYRLTADSSSFTTTLLPGTYDLVYERGYDTSTTYVNTLATGDTFVNGRRVLRTGVVINPGANTLNVDITSAMLSGSITYNGAALPAMNVGDLPDATLTLVARDTSARQRIAYVRWRYVSGGTYRLTADSSSYSTRLLPGTYDLVYERGYDTSTTYVNTLATGDTFVNGRRVLRTGVVINPGANTLNIDIPSSTVTGSVTYNGAALPAMNVGDLPDATLTLVALDTGARQRIAYVRWRYVSGGTYRLTADSGTYTTQLLPGTYDLVYERGYDTSTTYVNTLATGDTFVNGRRVLRTNVTVTPGMNRLDIDISAQMIGGAVTYNGAALPPTNVGDLPDATLILVARDTSARQRIGYVRWRYVSGGTYALTADSSMYSARLLPGTYDLLYERGYDTSTTYVNSLATNDTFVNGSRYLRRCIVVPPR